ncbi:MAG: MoaD/ThiS family protein [Thermoplasmata archaeon]|uniref:MoaD/ThiS family protein n=1 Tax=Candidatus Sysuiplasma superficiale TaxID=2823368 RepID=A0A8J8CAX5_9ARCH|nr:MoaD/ThiS family protein [Candidatus Sysuiplasma superficiale]MBX8644740.1 MoaD/ThiS family protein [Candidatus Sysuiplasma superficiale]
MKVRVEVFGRSKSESEFVVSPEETVQDLMRRLNIAPDAVVVFRNGEPVPVDEGLSEGDVLTFIEAASGG